MNTTLFALASCGLLPLVALTAGPNDGAVYKPSARPLGRSYAEWSTSWWRWYMQHPVANHPGIDGGTFDVTSGQSGDVWFLAAPLDFGTAVPRTRHITVAEDKRLFVGLVNAEMSSLEGVAGEQDQRDIANFLADHIVAVECVIDGDRVDHLAEDYRFESPQFAFTAPDPWIFGPAGAGQAGTSVADGYYVFLKHLDEGVHTLHLTGALHFDVGELGPEPVDLALDMTYVITVVGS